MLKIFALRGGIMMTMKTQADSYTHQFQNIFRIAYRRYAPNWVNMERELSFVSESSQPAPVGQRQS